MHAWMHAINACMHSQSKVITGTGDKDSRLQLGFAPSDGGWRVGPAAREAGRRRGSQRGDSPVIMSKCKQQMHTMELQGAEWMKACCPNYFNVSQG